MWTNFEFDDNDAVFDFGCGKGSVLFGRHW